MQVVTPEDLREISEETPTLESLEDKVDALAAQVATLVAHQQRQVELLREVGPIGKEVLRVASDRFSELEERGTLEFGAEAVNLLDTLTTSYTAEDVRLLGENLTTIMDTVRKVTQPDLLAVANELTDALHDGKKGRPVGLWGLFKATREREVQRGFTMLLAMLRRLGRSARLIGVSRQLPQRQITKRKAPEKAAAPGPVPETAPTATPSPIPGVALDAHGYLEDPTVWNRDLAMAIATSMGVMLNDTHWKVIDFARKHYLDTNVSANLRVIAMRSGVGTKELYTLFSKKPGQAIAKISGVPKPVGCI
ncbi:MAG: TusE/DsrC/DsvC family sulfur relay protein [Deltaproteobacteria bacterium]|nr:TusE/DsrC/DsvC family sulfur relay protein [Deltaproteobacteria bacterium]